MVVKIYNYKILSKLSLLKTLTLICGFHFSGHFVVLRESLCPVRGQTRQDHAPQLSPTGSIFGHFNSLVGVLLNKLSMKINLCSYLKLFLRRVSEEPANVVLSFLTKN